MPNQPPIPPILKSHLAPPPPNSLALISSTLTASANWLTLRFLYSLLLPLKAPSSFDYNVEGRAHDKAGSPNNNGAVDNVVLVSWLRSSNFFTDGLKKMGLSPTSLPLKILPLTSAPNNPSALLSSLTPLLSPCTALILDAPDLLIPITPSSSASSSTSPSPPPPPYHLLSTIHALRLLAHSCLISIQADHPLIHSRLTPLETSHAVLVTHLLHEARMVCSVRGLDTGASRDVGGVVRITRGGDVLDDDEEVEEQTNDGGKEEDGGGGDRAGKVEQGEWLWEVKRDGGVRVWERGVG